MTLPWDEKLKEISDQIKQGIKPEPVTTRNFIHWFDVSRRSLSNVAGIRTALADYDLTTMPDFEFVYIDSFISFVRAPEESTDGTQLGIHTDLRTDPTYRIGKLASANKKPTSVKPDEPIAKATMIMIREDFSQLPVMNNERDVKGVISWPSIGKRLALGKKCISVRDCMEPHKEISADTYIFDAVDIIIGNQYALIRDSANIISGIVTTSDLSLQFRQLGEPFLLLGEIENYIRLIIQDKYNLEELKKICDPEDKGREIHGIADLTIGEYLRLVENPERWERLKLNIDRDEFITSLDEIRKIRNDIMHFDPDTVDDEDMEKLRSFVRLMQALADTGVV